MAIRFDEIELPETWGRVRVPDALSRARFRVGKVPRQEYLPVGRYPVVDQGQSLIAGYCDDAASLYDGRLPVVVFGDHTRVFKLIAFPFVSGADGTKVLVPDRDLFDPEFMFYALSALGLPSRGYNRHFSLLREKTLPRPPMEEQRAIARVLRSVEKGRETTQQVLAVSRDLKRSFLERVFRDGLVSLADDPDREPWPTVSLAEVVPTDRPICYGILKPGPDIDDGVPYVKVRDYPDGAIHVGRVHRTSRLIAEQYRRSTLRGGDVLVSIRGTTGRVAVVPAELDGANITQDTARVTVDPRYNGDYVSYALQASPSQSYIREWTRGAAVKGINIRDLRRLRLPSPPAQVQSEIAAALRTLDSKISAEAARATALDALFNALLRDLMTGQARV